MICVRVLILDFVVLLLMFLVVFVMFFFKLLIVLVINKVEVVFRRIVF